MRVEIQNHHAFAKREKEEEVPACGPPCAARLLLPRSLNAAARQMLDFAKEGAGGKGRGKGLGKGLGGKGLGKGVYFSHIGTGVLIA